MQIGIGLPNTLPGTPGRLILDWARRAEAHGFSSLATIDRVVYPSYESLVALAAAAGATERIGLMTNVLLGPTRDPVLLAKEVGTLQYLTDDRFLLGIGPGWNAREYEVTGSHISERGRRTDEIMEALEALLTREGASYEGQYYRFRDVTILPRPRELPQVWVAGGSRIPDPTGDPDIHDTDYMHPGVVRRVLKWGKWLSRCTGTQEWVKRDWRYLQDEARKAGQDPDALLFGHTNFTYFTPFKDRADAEAVQRKYFERNMGDRRSWDHLRECYFTGTVADQIARLEDLAEAGLEYMVLGPLSADPYQIDVLGEEFLPRFA
jgi:alkanesulfonate monooxygenase SsuD/methylene tetrahydromethanopterin reductase-like flavin-dependent oxidoreductase (luciferase family)